MFDRTACSPFLTEDDLSACNEALDDIDVAAAIEAVSAILANLSGWTVYGTCTAIVRPNGSMLEPTTCLPAIPLEWPVRTVTEVIEDGVTLDPSEYTIMDDRWLIRLADPTTRINPGWSCGHRLDLPSSDIHSGLTITFTFGTDIPQFAKDAGIELLDEVARGCGGGACALPSAVKSVTTQGLSMSLDDASDEVSTAMTDQFPKVARFVALTNPNGLPLPPSVWSPDLPTLHVFKDPNPT